MKHFILLAFVVLFLPVSLTFSQEINNFSPKYGIYAAYNLNQHVADFRRLPGVPNCCPHFESGSGMGITLGALLELPLSDMFFLGLRLGYTTLDGLLTQKEGTIVITNGIAGDGEFEHKVDAAIGNMGLEVLFGISPLKNINLIKNINIYLGLRVGLNIRTTYEQSEQITKPATGATFLDSLGIDSHSRIRNVHTGDIPEANSFQLFAIGGLGYDLPLNSRGSLMVSPEIFYSFNLTDVVKDSVWSINSMRFGAAIKYQPQDIKYDFRTIEKIDTVRLTSPEIVTEKYIKGSPTVSQTKEEQNNKITTVDYYNRTDTILIPKIFRLSANVSAVGVDSSGKETPNPKFIVEEFISNRLDPLLNYIFFDDNNSVLLPKYRQLTKLESNDFTVEKLYSDSTLGIYYNILNIIGSRMHKYPEAKLRLVGCNSGQDGEKGNKELSKNRAGIVRDYLINSWEIDGGRIKIEARDLPEKASTPVDEPDKIQENRRVEIYSDNIEVLEPVFTTDTIRTVNPPIARFKPEIIAEAGLSKWKLTAIQDPRQIFNNFEREGGNEAIPKEIDWIFSSDQKSIPRQQKMITYELGATDKKGKSIITGEKKLPLELITIERKRTQRIGDMEIDKFALILFDFDKSEITGANKKITDFIKSRIKTESSIEILGYTDRTGDANYNKNLSQKRAETSKLAISRTDASALGIGEEELLYNNDIPEGRFYCRTINIIVKTPVK